MRCIIFLLLQLCVVVAFAQDTFLLHKSYAERYGYIKSFQDTIFHTDDSITAMRRLNKYEKWARDNNDIELAYHFRFLKLAHKDVDITDDKTINAFIYDLNKAEKGGYIYASAEGYALLSSRFAAQRMFSASLQYGLKAYNIYKDFPIEKFPTRIDYQHDIAIKYYIFCDYRKAKNYLLDLTKGRKETADEIITGGYYNTLALCYLELKQYDSALAAFNTIYNDAIRSHFFELASVAAGNIGHTYYLVDNNDSAIKWMTIEYNIAQKYIPEGLNGNLAHSSLLLAKIHYSKGMFNEADKELQKAIALYKKRGGIERKRFKKDFFLVLAQLRLKQKRIQEAYTYLDSARIAEDMLQKEFDMSKLLEAEYKIDSTNHELKLAQIEYKRKSDLYIRNAIISIISLLSIILLLLTNRYRLVQKQKKRLLEKEKQKTDMALTNAKKQLENFTKVIQGKNILIEKINEQIKNLESESKPNIQGKIIEQIQKSTILTEEEWSEFKVLFEQVHSGFIYRLKCAMPDLTPSEIRFLALRKLKLDNKEMSNMLGIGASAMRNYKYRLRKKYNMETDEALDVLIENI